MEQQKYNVSLTESETVLIGKLRAGAVKNKNIGTYFWLAIALSMMAIVWISRSGRNPFIALLGFVPLAAFFIFNSRISKQISLDAAEFLKQVKDANKNPKAYDRMDGVK